MRTPSSSASDVHLSPFAFPSETDARFLVLILAIAGSTMVLIQTLAEIFTESPLFPLLLALAVTVSLFAIAFYKARKSAARMIAANRWKTFPPTGSDPFKAASLQHMNDYIQKTVATIPELALQPIQFIWDETSKASTLPTGMAFGFGKQHHVCLRQGLHHAFTYFPEDPTFQSVLMHELGHIANRDVSKTVFATSLGKCFFPIAIGCIASFILYTIWALVDRMQRGLSLDPAQPGMRVLLDSLIKLLLLLVVVEIARSSILRVREYYADARARNWFGVSAPLTRLLSEHLEHVSQKASKPIPQKHTNKLAMRESLRQWFRTTIAPLHPTHKQRITCLENPRYLFRPSYEVAFLAGILSGVSLNANSSLFALLEVITRLTGYLNQKVQIAVEPMQSHLLVIILFFILSIAFFAILLAVFIIFGLVPIVGTVGLQIQQAAFVDQAQPTTQRLLTVQTVVALALTLGMGFISGCLLTPILHSLSLRSFQGGVSWPGIVGLAIAWSGIFLMWELAIVRFAQTIYLTHVESSVPRQKRRWLTRLSAILLSPLFLWMSTVQIAVTAHTINPTLISTSTLIAWCIIAGIIAWTMYGLIWTVAWGMADAKGWIKSPHCPHCQALIQNQSGLLKTCQVCHAPIASWAWSPAPIVFPPAPSPVKLDMDAPPPL